MIFRVEKCKRKNNKDDCVLIVMYVSFTFCFVSFFLHEKELTVLGKLTEVDNEITKANKKRWYYVGE